MSESEKSVQEFLQRWSRRKLGGVEDERRAPDAQAAEGDEARLAPAASAAPGAPDEAATAFDPASLPPIESITAATDVRAFLTPGVPPELTRAALRRAWVTDPNIRDFIGIAENQWDFTKPDGVPGFGPLELTAELHRMVTELHSATRRNDAAEAAAISGKTALPDRAATSLPDHVAASPVEAEPRAVTPRSEKNAAAQNDVAIDEATVPAVPRKHGGALPK
jgi:hypothetical protein